MAFCVPDGAGECGDSMGLITHLRTQAGPLVTRALWPHWPENEVLDEKAVSRRRDEAMCPGYGLVIEHPW